MAKYTPKRVKHICSLISEDSYTIAEICSLSGIAESTYYEWIEKRPEFLEAVTRARAQFDELIVREAKNSLRKLVNGYDVEEKKTVYQNDKDGKPKIKEQTVTKKHYQPNPGSVEFVLTNKKSDEYRNRQSTELTGKDGKDLIPDRPMTLKEAKEFLKELSAEI
jgi:hypothetical protein